MEQYLKKICLDVLKIIMSYTGEISFMIFCICQDIITIKNVKEIETNIQMKKKIRKYDMVKKRYNYLPYKWN